MGSPLVITLPLRVFASSSSAMLFEEGLNKRGRKEVAAELPGSSSQDDIMLVWPQNSWFAEEGWIQAGLEIEEEK